MRIQGRKLIKQPDAIVIGFSHADDSATADCNSGLAHVLERPQPVFIIARRDDLAVKLGGCIEVVVVGMEARFSETAGLGFVQHTKRATDFHSKRRHTANHFQNRVEFRPITDLTPSGPHTESTDPLVASFARRFHDVLDGKQRLPVQTCFIVRALRAVSAILRTTTGFDRQQLAQLHLTGFKILTMRRLCRE